MNNDHQYRQIDSEGRLVIPPELVSSYGMKPGDRIRIEAGTNGLTINRSPHDLAKLYIEPTSMCNLDCRTCIRNIWDEPQGMMSKEVFAKVLEALRALPQAPTLFFGGFGEPLFHPDIIDMVAQAKAVGARVELITNGTLLTRDTSKRLLDLGLDVLWVSLDGATPESYSDIRLGAALPQILENLTGFHSTFLHGGVMDSCSAINRFNTELGIAFVAMKRNIADLPAIIDIGRRFGVKRVLVTNVLPYTREMIGEPLFYRALNGNRHMHLNLPGIDVTETTHTPIYEAISKVYGHSATIQAENSKDRCPFIENGAGAIGWDGNLSPCLPLLHSHTTYLDFLHYEERFSRSWPIGNVADRNLLEIWNTQEHLAFRERVQAFDFSPCTTCGSCELLENNEEDCFGNAFPTCGGCLWAQGVIRCP